MQSRDFVFDPRPNYPLLVTAKRYWDPNSQYLDDPTAFTLICLHATGFHKELWEPTVDDLVGLAKKDEEKLRIREIWTIDAPNHGDAAALNAETLSWGYELSFRWEEYGRATHSLLSGLGKGIDTDFTKHRLIGMGHSMGAVSLLLSMNFFPKVAFESVVLVEPMVLANMNIQGGGNENFLAKGSANRRDIWSSKAEAYQLLKARGSWKAWDDRVLRLYVEHGLRPLPTREYPDKTDGVTLKCPRKQETLTYLDTGLSFVYRSFKSFTERVPIHLVYGSVDDYVSRELKEDVINNAIGGVQKLASFRRIPKAGHLALQTHPTGVAQAIYDALTEKPSCAKL